MSDRPFEVPVVFLIFKRPETTQRVFSEIARAKPKKLFIIADGPQRGNSQQEKACRATRAIVEKIDWDCEVFRNYAEVNMGLDARAYSGFDWVFEKVDRAIIFEDDTLPHPTLFRFHEELLSRYADNPRILSISGPNYKPFSIQDSYYFSSYFTMWGWSTWRRAWRGFDRDMKEWPSFRSGGWLAEKMKSRLKAMYYGRMLDLAFEKKTNWDYRWLFYVLRQEGLCITPKVNLVSNIGFGGGSTNTWSESSIWAEKPLEAMAFPLKHPASIARNWEMDAEDDRIKFSLPGLLKAYLKLILPPKRHARMRRLALRLLGR